MSIHSTALVSPDADIAPTAEIGPFCVIETGASVGEGCVVAARAVVKEKTSIGPHTTVGEGAVLGGLPQHTRANHTAGRVMIGSRCTIRENVTVHRPLDSEAATTVGNDCFLMVGAHVAHDCQVGDHVMLTNNVLLGGHVEVGDRAVLGGAVAVHQFCRIGRLAMIGGCARIVQDVPPFVLTDGSTGMIVGLNRIGLRRAGMDVADVKQLKEAYRLIYRQGLPLDDTIEAIETQFAAGPAAEYAEFFRTGKRGFVQERRSPPRPVIRLHPAADDDAPTRKRLAG